MEKRYGRIVLILVVLMLSRAPAIANAQDESGFHLPKDGMGLLDDCGEIVNQLDSPPAKLDPVREMKFGWCVGYLQATQDRIMAWRMSADIQIRLMAQAKAQPTHSYMAADDDFVNTCIPNEEVAMGQLARVVVKWLREHPEKLHEPTGFLMMEALENSFPCPAAAKETVRPSTVKP